MECNNYIKSVQIRKISDQFNEMFV